MVTNPVVGCHHLPLGPQQHTHTHAYHEPGGRLPLLSARPAMTFPAVGLTPDGWEGHCGSGTKQYNKLVLAL